MTIMPPIFRLLLPCSLLLVSAVGLSSVYSSCASSPTSDPYVKVQFVSPSTGWIVGSRLLHTRDGGKTWQVVQENGDGTVKSQTVVADLHRFQFINPEVGVTWLGNVFKRSTDRGQTWQDTFTIPPDKEYQWLSFFFLSPKEGWAAGKYVYYTDDGGKSWQQLGTSPVGDHRRQRQIGIDPEMANYQPVIRFTNAKHGLMVKLDGLVFLTEDGGKKWEQVFQIDQQLQDVFFSGVLDGWIVGNMGSVIHTRDGGHTWVPIQVPTKANLYSVAFVNSKAGCIVGSKSTVLCTKDAGFTWSLASIKGSQSPSELLVSVSFSDELHGWAVGGLGSENFSSMFSSPSNIVIATNDGGETWQAINPASQ